MFTHSKNNFIISSFFIYKDLFGHLHHFKLSNICIFVSYAFSFQSRKKTGTVKKREEFTVCQLLTVPCTLPTPLRTYVDIRGQECLHRCIFWKANKYIGKNYRWIQKCSIEIVKFGGFGFVFWFLLFVYIFRRLDCWELLFSRGWNKPSTCDIFRLLSPLINKCILSPTK